MVLSRGATVCVSVLPCYWPTGDDDGRFLTDEDSGSMWFNSCKPKLATGYSLMNRWTWGLPFQLRNDLTACCADIGSALQCSDLCNVQTWVCPLRGTVICVLCRYRVLHSRCAMKCVLCLPFKMCNDPCAMQIWGLPFKARSDLCAMQT